jgi:hypothetical protein
VFKAEGNRQRCEKLFLFVGSTKVSSFKQKVAVSPFTNAEGDWQRIQN